MPANVGQPDTLHCYGFLFYASIPPVNKAIRLFLSDAAAGTVCGWLSDAGRRRRTAHPGCGGYGR